MFSSTAANKDVHSLRIGSPLIQSSSFLRSGLHRVRLYSSTENQKDGAQAQKEITLETLPEELRASFLQGETDGIMQLAPALIGKFTGDDIITAALEAVHNSKGQAAGIINAMIASCSLEENSHPEAPALAWDIFNTWEELAAGIELYPDMVTFCCTYCAVSKATEDQLFWQRCADQVLERAQRHSKKLAGTKRRKVLNSISRRGGKGKDDAIRALDRLDELQESYGVDFNVLLENDDVIVINKPSGMVCFHSRKTTDGKIGRKKKVSKKTKKGAANEDGDDEIVYNDISLEDALIDVGLSLSTLNPDALGIVHRIDRGTSGCIILAKSDGVHARLVTEFFTRRANKRYTALVPYHSSLEDQTLESSGVIDEEVGGRPAKSIYNVKQEFGKLALQLDIETRTGRKHQVRIHCSKDLGRPIFLDPLYSEIDSKTGSNKKKRQAELSESTITDGVKSIIEGVADPGGRRFFLHASTLSIEEFGVNVTADLPSWWQPVLDDLKKSV